MSVSVTIARATAVLAEAGVASARVDAELLAAHVLATTRGRLLLAPDLTEEQHREYASLIAARGSRVPLQHLTGRAAFRHLDLAVGPGVFVPRPETELLVEWGLAWLRGRPDAPTVVDLCAGSGAIALSVATEHPGARVYAVEREPEALAWLRRNAAGHPVTVVAGDVTDPAVLADLDAGVDLVLCNPPYVPLTAAAGLPVEVTGHDPAAAVFGGPDGLDLFPPLLRRVSALLAPGGAVGIEHDDTHGDAVPALMRAAGFERVRLHHDLAGRPRFTTARRAGGWQDGAP
ncbi:peptide chain release factor N(5)-glutamine methyltransferase [Luedemannella helvata]|uniref:Release factor glutamine methyltransferase n=1 Tax=Luedemannella helvata TaxID=349315 RepID=A0ABP4W8D9_9ACTN